jgi:hypothetical protein
MAQAPRVEDMLRRLTGQPASRDALAPVARELRRHRHDGVQERSRRRRVALGGDELVRRRVPRATGVEAGVAPLRGTRSITP